jgi:hypothetical protein
MESTRYDGRKSTLAEAVRFRFDGDMTITTSMDLTVFDDEHSLLHAATYNEELNSQANYPIRIVTGDYTCLQHVDCIMTLDNFSKFLDTGYMKDLTNEAQKEYMRKWAARIKNQAIQPMEAEPYYSETITIMPAHTTVIKRDDGITHAQAYKPISVKVVADQEGLQKSIESANTGDIIMLSKTAEITEPLTIDKSIVIVSDGAKISNKITISDKATSFSISGVSFSYDDGTTSGNGKGKTMISAACKELKIDNCEFDAQSAVYNVINSSSTDITISNCTFYSEGTYIYNAIEFSQKVPIENLTIENNRFVGNLCKNNCISVFEFVDGAKVYIKKNHFDVSVNALRISNYTSAKNVIFYITDNTYDATFSDQNVGYAGFFFCQKVKEDESYTGMTIIIKNLVGPGGKVMAENGTGVDQVWYTYQCDTVPNVLFA